MNNTPLGLSPSHPLVPINGHKITRLNNHPILLIAPLTLPLALSLLPILMTKACHIIADSFEDIGKTYAFQSRVLRVLVLVQV